MFNIDLSTWNWNSAKAAGKNVASYVAGGVSVAVAWHFLPAGMVNPTEVADNINHVINGLEEVAKGLAGLIATGTAVYTVLRSGSNATPKNQAIALTQAVPGTQIVTTPEIAKATPEAPSVMSRTDVKVISKGT